MSDMARICSLPGEANGTRSTRDERRGLNAQGSGRGLLRGV